MEILNNKNDWYNTIDIRLNFKEFQIIRDAIWNNSFNDITSEYNYIDLSVPYNTTDLSHLCDDIDKYAKYNAEDFEITNKQL